MAMIGLTGGIASGKSTVAARLADHGAVVIDSDRLAREVVAPGTPGLAAVVEEFGTEVLGPDGSLDRARLGEVAFADVERRRALEAIVHPLVAEAGEKQAAAAPAGSLVVRDIPLLVEAGLADLFEVVVVVDCPTELQIQRMVEQRSMTPEEARARIAAQATREERLAAATHVIDNAGTLEELLARVDALYAELTG